MTMFNITDGNNNVSRDKPVEHIDGYIGPDRRCLGRLACRELGRLPECLLKFGSERACAPPRPVRA